MSNHLKFSRRTLLGTMATTIDMTKLARDAADTIERARKEASKEGADKGINELFTR